MANIDSTDGASVHTWSRCFSPKTNYIFLSNYLLSLSAVDYKLHPNQGSLTGTWGSWSKVHSCPNPTVYGGAEW